MFSKHQEKEIGDKSKMKDILACSFCRKIVTNPKTLQCYHTFCNSCLEQLPKETIEGGSGLSCSVCKVFSKDSNVQSDLLMNEFLEMFQISQKGEAGACKQCTEKKSNWICQDCKMDLCDHCHELHSRVPLLKNHYIRPLTAGKDTKMVIDRVVFCSIHDDEPVKLNCVECALPLCIKCKVTEHENHKTETVQKAIERVIPILNEDSTKIQVKIKELDQMKVDVQQQMEKVKQIYCKSRLDADENLKQLTTSAKTQHKNLSEELIMKEEEQLAKLQIAQEKIECKLKEYHNICRWVAITTQAAKGTSLLTEVENGLLERVRDVSLAKYKLKAIVDQPSLDANEAQIKMEDMVGKLKYSKVVAVSTSASNNTGGKHTIIDLSTLVGKEFQVVHNIQLPNICYRLSVINDEIWAPIPALSYIQVYNTNGQLVRTIQQAGKQPRSIAQLSSGEIVMASNVGLHVLDQNEAASVEIVTGNFADLDVIEESISALNVSTGQFVRYNKSNNGWEASQTHALHMGFNGTGTVIDAGQYLLVSCGNNITRYNTNGQLVGEYGIYSGSYPNENCPGHVYTPYMSMIDDANNMLIADCSNARLQVLLSDFEWKVVAYNGKPEHLGSPYDCKLDNESRMWVVNSGNKLICYGFQ